MKNITEGQQKALENAAKICNDRLISYMQDDLCRSLPYICVPRRIWEDWRDLLDPTGIKSKQFFEKWVGLNKNMNNVYKKRYGREIGLRDEVIDQVINEFTKNNKSSANKKKLDLRKKYDI